MNETREQLQEKREYLSRQLAWAKSEKMWAHADRYLSELDAVNLRLNGLLGDKRAMIELKPCPFCGTRAAVFHTATGSHVRCQNGECDLRCDSVERWQMRAHVPEEKTIYPEAVRQFLAEIEEPRMGIHEDGTEELKSWEHLWNNLQEAAKWIRAAHPSPQNTSCSAAGHDAAGDGSSQEKP